MSDPHRHPRSTIKVEWDLVGARDQVGYRVLHKPLMR